MLNQTPLEIIQKYILLATGAPSSNALRNEVIQLYEQTNDLSQVAKIVDTYMAQQAQADAQGAVGVVQAVAGNGFGLNLSGQETQLLITDLGTLGVDSWSKLFAFVTTEFNQELHTILDQRSNAANLFTDQLAELNKDNDYNGAQASRAAHEWLAGIGISEESLSAASEAIAALINRFNGGNVEGKAFDGYISGATVFIDENNDGLQNAAEISTTTGAQGQFTFTDDAPDGHIVLTGGTDIGTTQAFTGTLSAPQGSLTVSPLTTLVDQLLINRQAPNTPVAEDILFQSLNLTRVDLSVFDPINVILDQETSAAQKNTALQLQAVTMQITSLQQIANTILGNGFPSNNAAIQAVNDSLLSAMSNAQQNNQMLDLASTQTITDIIVGTANQGSNPSNIIDMIEQAATLLSEINGFAQQISENSSDPQTDLTLLFKLQTLTQTDITDDINSMLAGGDLSTIVTQFSGNDLEQSVTQVVAGSLDGMTPVNEVPVLISSTPADNSDAVAIDSNIVLNFNEPVAAGTGNIVISDGTDTRTIAVTDTTQVSFSGNTVTLNPSTDLNSTTSYNIQVANGVITSTAGIAYTGISGTNSLNFSTPMPVFELSSSTPADNAGAVAVDSNIVLNFSESVTAGTGNIIISDGADTRTLAVTDTTQVSFNGNTVTINLSADLNIATSYNIQMASGVITSTAGEAYAGISDTNTLNFNTPILVIELSTIEQDNSSSGFVINGTSEGSGRSVSSAGDVNGDGLADLIIGADFNDPNGYSSGASFVVFGKSDGSSVELSSIENGSGGFVINGVSENDVSGASVSAAGDVNGDGLADLIVGASGDDPNGNSNSGASFVIFGKTNGSEVRLSSIENSNNNGGFVINANVSSGFVINGVSEDDRSGGSVSNAGDVNGDGLADLIIGASGDDPNGNSNSGASFVVFGKTNALEVELSAIENSNNNDGFVINGVSETDESGVSVSAAGDVNGDGLADLVIGAHRDDPHGYSSGASFVVFGKSDGSNVELSSIENGTGGFVINGVSGGDFSGRSVSGAGDVNGDGLADLIIGAHYDDPNGNSSGASFVVFGKSDGSNVELSSIENGTGGFVINGVGENDVSGVSVSGAGDVNGDGFTDLIVSAQLDDPNGDNSGASFVVFGGQNSSATVGASDEDMLTGNTSANQLVAGAGNDVLVGNGGTDVLRGGAGDDILAVSDLTFASLDGGTGTDTLRFDAALALDLRTTADSKLTSIEVIDLSNDGGNSSISLNITDVLNLNETQTVTNTLVIHGSAGDIVNLDGSSNGQAGSWVDAGGSVYEFTAGGIGVIGTVTIDVALTVDII